MATVRIETVTADRQYERVHASALQIVTCLRQPLHTGPPPIYVRACATCTSPGLLRSSGAVLRQVRKRGANPDTHCERLFTFVRLSQVRKQEIRQKERRQVVDLPERGITGGEHHATWEQREEQRRVSRQRSGAESKTV